MLQSAMQAVELGCAVRHRGGRPKANHPARQQGRNALPRWPRSLFRRPASAASDQWQPYSHMTAQAPRTHSCRSKAWMIRRGPAGAPITNLCPWLIPATGALDHTTRTGLPSGKGSPSRYECRSDGWARGGDADAILGMTTAAAAMRVSSSARFSRVHPSSDSKLEVA